MHKLILGLALGLTIASAAPLAAQTTTATTPVSAAATSCLPMQPVKNEKRDDPGNFVPWMPPLNVGG
ncbi:MAG: hypothetical protein JO349_02985 [Candidatus Eremiobacteraeota bacterium]|nr:hypothetical protein [Candidatus Eremiobacteraeota bacterium]